MDAANRLTGLNARTLTYDDNGNLTGDGNQVYVWNARDQLTQIKSLTGTVLASFSYDALGRRQGKTVYGEGTGYVYDGVNIVQELNGPTLPNSVPANVRASYISGGVDEVFAQLSGTGASAKVASYLTDALGSTVRLTDGAGNKLVDYTYDPYGATTADAFVVNPFQYTGRENDGNGLYYYRARYYSPGMARFISSDPIGLGGGINTYAYAIGNPIKYTDPTGKIVPLVIAGVCSAGGCETLFLAAAAGALWWQQTHPIAAANKPPRVEHPDAASEHKAYKDAYNQPPPPFNDNCEKLKWQLTREKALLAARTAWDAKWGNHHPDAIAQSSNAIRNIENKMKSAGCSCS